MLNSASFRAVIENTPLVSIDLCIICDGHILLGLRSNEPLKGVWFTPGARIFKNETWVDCLKRIAQSELGLVIEGPGQFRLMGVWDHFYSNSAFSENVSTHYVNLPHYMFIKHRPDMELDSQHDKMDWFDLGDVANNDDFHQYIRNYAIHLLEVVIDND